MFIRRWHPLQCSCLENPVDGRAWWAAVQGIAKSRERLSDFPFTFHFHASEKEMATHSSVLACRIPGMGEPGGLPSMGSHRVGHDWSDLAAAAQYVTLWNYLFFTENNSPYDSSKVFYASKICPSFALKNCFFVVVVVTYKKYIKLTI